MLKAYKLLYISLKVNLLNELQFRANFFMQFVFTFIDLAFSIATLQIVFSRVERLNTWSREELLLLIGFHMAFRGILELFLFASLMDFARRVKSGDFDYTLLMPYDAQFLSLITRVSMWKFGSVIVGMVTIVYALSVQPIQLQLGNVLLAIIMSISALCIIGAVFALFAACAFWVVESSNLMRVYLETLSWAGKWPVSIFPGVIRVVFTFIIPVGLAITVPVETILNKVEVKWMIIEVLFSIGLLVFARVVWKKGLQRYSSATS